MKNIVLDSMIGILFSYYNLVKYQSVYYCIILQENKFQNEKINIICNAKLTHCQMHEYIFVT